MGYFSNEKHSKFWFSCNLYSATGTNPNWQWVWGTMISITATSSFCVTCKKIHSDRDTPKTKSPLFFLAGSCWRSKEILSSSPLLWRLRCFWITTWQKMGFRVKLLIPINISMTRQVADLPLFSEFVAHYLANWEAELPRSSPVSLHLQAPQRAQHTGVHQHSTPAPSCKPVAAW